MTNYLEESKFNYWIKQLLFKLYLPPHQTTNYHNIFLPRFEWLTQKSESFVITTIALRILVSPFNEKKLTLPPMGNSFDHFTPIKKNV